MPTTAETLVDAAEVRRALALLLPAGQVTELRILGAVTTTDRWPHTASGYFDDASKLSEALNSVRAAKSCYIIPNVVNPTLLARAANRIRKADKGGTTSDNDIVGRYWLLVDCDPVRASGISATDDEHKAALGRCEMIRSELHHNCGWPEPIIADSGNGGHLLYRIDEAVADHGLIERCLKSLAAKFSDDVVKVDTTVHNPARIWKLYGTRACKGDSTADRPHRMSRILSAPDTLHVVSREQLEELASDAPADHESNGQASFGIDDFIVRHHLDLAGPDNYQGGRRWTFNHSPMCDHHGDGPYLIQFESGALSAGCHHQSCTWSWHDLRAKFEPKQSRPSAANGDDAPPTLQEQDALLRLIKEALECLPPEYYNDADLLLKEVCYPLHDTAQKNPEIKFDLYKAFVKFAQQTGPDKCSGLLEVWNSCGTYVGKKKTIASLFKVAMANGFDPKRPHVDSVENKERAKRYLKDVLRERLVHWNAYWVNDSKRQCYRERSIEEMQDDVLSWLESECYKVEPKHAVATLKSIRARTRLPKDATAPLWLGEAVAGFENLSECVSLTDGILVNLRTGQATQRTDNLFNTYSLPIPYDPGAKEPELFMGLLHDALKYEYQIKTFLRFLAYCLTPSVHLQKGLMICGTPGSGKGTLMHVASGLFGLDQIFSPTLADLDEKHGLAGILGKAITVVWDMHNAVIKSGRLLDRIAGITVGDPTRVEPKFVNGFDVILTCKLILVGNKVPTFKDTAIKLKRRFEDCVLETYMRGKSKPLKAKLANEILAREKSGMFNLLLREYKPLLAEGLPIHPDSAPGRMRLDLQGRAGSCYIDFAEKRLLVGEVTAADDGECSECLWAASDALWSEMKAYCEDEEIPMPTKSKGTFTAELLAALQAMYPHNNIRYARESRKTAADPDKRDNGIAGVAIRPL
jgi:hypothetical protein